MNFLGHLYLAGDDPQIRIGNFIADHIKGIPLTHFPAQVTRGIMMHRAIDYHTDTHPALVECRSMLRPGYRKYAGVVLDVLLDYFIAQNWESYSPLPLKPFIYRFYLQLIRYWRILPPYWKRLLPTFIKDNRIYRYRHLDGICESLDIMARTTSLPDASDFARRTVEENYEEMNERIMEFMPDIISAMHQQFDITPIGWGLAQPGTIELYQNK